MAFYEINVMFFKCRISDLKYFKKMYCDFFFLDVLWRWIFGRKKIALHSESDLLCQYDPFQASCPWKVTQDKNIYPDAHLFLIND